MNKKEENKFAHRLRELREERNLTLFDLAIKSGININTLIKWESKERTPRMEFIIKLAKFFGVSSDYLLGLED